MKNTKIGIIGRGNVGGSLERGLKRVGYDVRAVGSDKAAIREVAGSAEIVFLALPFVAIDELIKNAGDVLAGKLIVDVTNSLDASMNLAVGFTTSGAEELQKKIPTARVVKAFNTVFAPYMETGHLDDKQLSAFVASDDAEAKATVIGIAKELGFDTIDAGPLQSARSLEPLALFLIQLGFVYGMGPKIGFKLFHS
jgi:predicted dinucleotide-binding enzyme